jgi:class 3 adenylate cyclase
MRCAVGMDGSEVDQRRQERKVVTVLFCDLVGFTQRAEEMDPEDVASLLEPYHARLKTELERFGGTVEKFIGDAVMALFGAPTAHEDDPERAVRAALAIRDSAEKEHIELRIGITTGEALVSLGASPEHGETMATGDVVNTAARLQAAAPVNGILVSERTHEATKDAIEYRDAEPVEAKGKARPIPVWEAVAVLPMTDADLVTPFVGREDDLRMLEDALARVEREPSCQLVTLVGVPGIGKSRLVHELAKRREDVLWRHGRCLPYGDGITFWALGEIVKAQTGILESDTVEQAEAKLEQTIPDDDWVRESLRPLVGLSSEGVDKGAATRS